MNTGNNNPPSTFLPHNVVQPTSPGPNTQIQSIGDTVKQFKCNTQPIHIVQTIHIYLRKRGSNVMSLKLFLLFVTDISTN